MRNSLAAIALAASIATACAVDRAAADVDCTVGSTMASGCSGNTRISPSAATCLTATWDRSYNASAAGYNYSITNECSDYGNIMVHKDFKDQLDWMVCEDGESSATSVAKIRGIACCFEGEQDLCWERQVKADSEGRIKRVQWSDANNIGFTLVTVATHQQRYDFCRENPNDVYCKVDPSGDANTAPPPPSTECDGEPCTVQHCRDDFEGSTAATGSNSCTTLGLDYPPLPYGYTASAPPDDDEWPLEDNSCSVSYVNCATNTSDGEGTGSRADVNAWNDPTSGTETAASYGIDVNIHDMDDLRYCDWKYCTDSGALGRRWGIVEGGCPESATMASCLN